MNRLISRLQNNLIRAVLTVSLVAVAFGFGVGNGFQANAEALTPEATQYQVDGNPFKAEQEAGKENFQNSANKLFQENKKPLEAPETTQKIGEALTKPAKATKQNLEGIAGNIQDTADDVQQKGENAYEEQKNKPKSDLKDVFENIKEKLNLDEPIYPGTKEFINDVEEKAEETVKGTQRAVSDGVS
jgi:hypothetical protein